jgi:hypothetical protein
MPRAAVGAPGVAWDDPMCLARCDRATHQLLGVDSVVLCGFIRLLGDDRLASQIALGELERVTDAQPSAPEHDD